MSLKLKSMKYLTILSLFLGLTFVSCGDDDTVDLPACIDTELDTFKVEACAGTADLTLWRFRGQDVYCFAYGTCISDTYADIFDADCNLICTLGGISGNNDCDGTAWDQNATYISLLYQH